ncbi:hypothetical protein LguiB_028659 [Lonicera macranthoides]
MLHSVILSFFTTFSSLSSATILDLFRPSSTAVPPPPTLRLYSGSLSFFTTFSSVSSAPSKQFFRPQSTAVTPLQISRGKLRIALLPRIL